MFVETFEKPNHCEHCKFWFRASVMYGACHRFPPQIARRKESKIDLTPPTGINPGEGFIGDFPYTTSRDWCGEWQPRPDEWVPGNWTPVIEMFADLTERTEEQKEKEE